MNRLYEEESIRNIAEAIREKNGTNNTYTVAQMADAILNLSIGSSDGGIVPSGEITIKENGRYDVTNFASAVVTVAGGTTGVKTGSFVLETDYPAYKTSSKDNSYVIPHGLGRAPTIFSLYVEKVEAKDETSTMILGAFYNENYQLVTRFSNGTGVINHTNNAVTVDAENIYIHPSSSGYNLMAGYTYRWFALA